MRLIRSGILCLSGVSAIAGCTQHATTDTVARPVTGGSDRALMTKDNQAAMQTLSADRQAVLPTTAQAPTSRSADAVISSLKVAVATITPSRDATTQPANNNVAGTVTFTQVGSMLILVADLSGLQPNTSHSLEIHNTDDLSAPDLSSAGDVWSLGPDNTQSMLGNLGNVDADVTGKAYFERTLGDASVGGENDVVGRSVIVRELPADPSKPSQGQSARIAGGVIERREQ